MRKKFCPKCGREVEKLHDGLCEKCFLEKTKLEIPEKIALKECKRCGKIYFDKNSAETVEGAVDKVLTKILEKPDIQSATYRIKGDKIHVALNLKYGDLEKPEERIILFVLKKITCKSCSMVAVGYYQSIIQLRVPEKLIEKIVEDMQQQVENFRECDAMAFISKIERKKEGVDIYIGSKSVAKKLAKCIKTKFKAKIKISNKLGGFVDGRQVFRDTILISISD